MTNGILFECPTFAAARAALLREIVLSSLPDEDLDKSHKVQTDGIGDFSVVRTIRGDTGKITHDSSVLHFVRGAKAISLRGRDDAEMKNVDVEPIAKMLDELLKNPPVKQAVKEPATAAKK